MDRIFTVITKSGVSCPTVMCDIFFSLREAAAKRFQGEPPLPQLGGEHSAPPDVLARNSPVSGKEHQSCSMKMSSQNCLCMFSSWGS